MFVVDTNIVFSILIGGRRIKELFLRNRNRLGLTTPETMLEEVEKLLPKAAGIVNAEPSLVREIYNTLVKPYVKTFPEDAIPEETREKAKKLVEEVDPSDWPFVALAMHLGVPLWTGDKKIIKLAVDNEFREFKAVDTRGVEMLLEGKPWKEVEEYLKRKYG